MIHLNDKIIRYKNKERISQINNESKLKILSCQSNNIIFEHHRQREKDFLIISRWKKIDGTKCVLRLNYSLSNLVYWVALGTVKS